MARQPREATPTEVREWARSNGWDVGDRGRFSTELVAEFNKAHRRNNLVYGGGSGAPSQPSQSRSTQAPARATSRSSDSGPARRSTRQAPSSTGSNVTEIVRSEDMDERAKAMVSEAINALSAAKNVGGHRGEPILLTVTAQRLAYSA